MVGAKTVARLNLCYTTKAERIRILEAIKIIDRIYKLDYVNCVSVRSSQRWEEKFIKQGWAPGYGVFKKAFMKGKIVIKIGPTVQLNREMDLWRKTRNKPEFRQFRKNLARIFGVYRGFLIQRKIKKVNGPGGEYCKFHVGRAKTKCKAVAIKLKINDWWYNHGHDSNNNPIYFDSIVDNR